jgi:hypothetical protein
MTRRRFRLVLWFARAVGGAIGLKLGTLAGKWILDLLTP